MKVEQFQSAFGHVAEAPGGMDKIRSMVYHLAFTGKLAEPTNDDVETLVESLSNQQPGSRRRPLGALEVAGLHSIPNHWRWVSISTIGHDWGQKKPESDFTYIDVTAIDNRAGAISESVQIVSKDKAPSRARRIVKRGAVIYSTIRPYLLNVAVVERDYIPPPIASTAFAVIQPFAGVKAKYVHYYLRSPSFVAYVESVQTGVAYPAINDKIFFSAAFPLAPTEEQERIISRVETLLGLCDQLELQQKERAERLKTLTRAALGRLTRNPNLEAVEFCFERIEPASPSDLRETVASLAVCGRLVQQDTNDETADECLNRLSLATARAGSSLSALAIPRLPASWAIIQFQDVAVVAGGLTLGRKVVGKKAVSVPYLRVANVKRGELDLGVMKEMTVTEDEVVKYTLHYNDLLMTEGGDRDKLGRAAIWRGELSLCLHQNHVFRARMRSEELLCEWFELYFNSPEGRSYFESVAKQTTNLASINMRQVRECPIPFPPIEEQRRIIALVKGIFSLIKTLEDKLAERDKLSERYARLLVTSLTGTRTGQREKMKVPKTELISIVRSGAAPGPKEPAPLATLLRQRKGQLIAKTLWQQSGLPIDAFYLQLKSEIARGWITTPEAAVVREVAEA